MQTPFVRSFAFAALLTGLSVAAAQTPASTPPGVPPPALAEPVPAAGARSTTAAEPSAPVPAAQEQPEPAAQEQRENTSAEQGPTLGGPATVEHRLANGMKVLVREDHRAPTVVHLVLYRVGSIDEVNGLTGISHALEHMMFKGTKNLGVGEFSRRVAERGGRENAFTGRDYTGYFQQIHRSHLAEMMALEADRMANLVIDDAEFASEIRVVMEERRWRTEDRATSLVYEQLMATAFIASPYRKPVVGWMSDLESMTAEDLREWYRLWYSPSNAILVVAGDVSADEVLRLAEQTYGQIEASEVHARKPQEEPEQRGVRRVAVKAPAENPYLMMGFHVPRLVDVENDSDPYALEMLAAVLDADANGRLTRNLVRGSRVANQAGASYGLTARGPALFMLDGTPAEGQDTAAVEKALREEIARIAKEGVREDELQRIKAQYVAGEIYKRDSVMAQAMEIGGLEVSGYSHRDADRILDKMRQVSAAQVQAVAGKYFGDDELTVVNLLPQPLESKPASAPPAGLRH